jgi:hypothetical protein
MDREPSAALITMVLAPEPGRIIDPNTRSLVLLRVIGLRIVAVTLADAVAVDWACACWAKASAANV